MIDVHEQHDLGPGVTYRLERSNEHGSHTAGTVRVEYGRVHVSMGVSLSADEADELTMVLARASETALAQLR